MNNMYIINEPKKSPKDLVNNFAYNLKANPLFPNLHNFPANVNNQYTKENNEKKEVNKNKININNKGKDNNFPQGTKYEKEISFNFKYFNIFWYDPNKSNDFDSFKNSFKNVLFYKGYDLESILKFFKKESSYEWIVIISGPKGEIFIQNLEQFQCIKYLKYINY